MGKHLRMVDLIPEGYISLTAAFDLFHDLLWNGGSPVAELRPAILISQLPPSVVTRQIAELDAVTNAQLAEFIRPFAHGELEALVREPGSAEHFAIPPQEWTTAFFPERFFLASEIGAGHGDYWDAIAERTPIIRRGQLDAWLAQLKSKVKNPRGRDLPPVFALRDCLIGLVMDGVLPAKEAEASAAKWGLRPFATSPPASRFNPMAEPVWSLAMTVAWISMRTVDAVRDSWTAYRTECWEWFPTNCRVPLDGGADWWFAEGAELRSLDASSLSELGMLEALDADKETKVLSVKSAREDLWRYLAEGSISATGLDAAGEAVQIPAHKWPYLELAGNLKGADYVIQRSVSLKAAYTELTFLRSAVIGLWPPVSDETITPAFDLANPDWTLWEAAQWVGCKGQVLSSAEIAGADLDDRGAEILFDALFREKLGATGLNHKRVREIIPAPYWELATTDPEQFRERHYVSFIDDILKGYGGQFTAFGEDKPRWFGIQIKRDALLNQFPEFTGAHMAISAGSPVPSGTRKRRKADKLAATRQALAECYPSGPPKGLAIKQRLITINHWHAKNGSSPVSATTVLRALKPK